MCVVDVTQNRPSWWPPVVLMAGGWLVLIVVQFFGAGIHSGMLLLAVPVIYGSWLVPIVATIVGTLLLWRRIKWVGVAASLTVGVVMTLVMASANWFHVYATVWFTWHKSDFEAVAHLSDDRNWNATAPQGYYGPRLPSEYQYLSSVQSLSDIGRNNGTPVWFLSQFTGIPDGAAGYAHVTGDIDPDAFLDGFGDRVRPTVDLGDGWWWVE
jgi:hypothetical protein